jgi:hypothetical protein
VRIQIPGSVPIDNGSGSGSNSGSGSSPDPDLIPDPAPFFSDFKDGKKLFFHIFFLYLTQAYYVKILFYEHKFRPLNTFMRKGKDPDPDL